MDKTICFNSLNLIQLVFLENFRLMNGKPLFYYIINTLLKSKYITKIIINIDNKFTEDYKKYFPSGIDFIIDHI